MATRLREWLAQTGVPISPRLFVLITTGGALVGGCLAHLVIGGPVIDVVGVAAGGAVYPLVLHGRHDRRRRAVVQALPQAIDRLRDSLASTIPIDIALARLGTDAGPEPLRPSFRLLTNELALGATFSEAVQHWADGLADRTADWVSSALILHNQVGPERFGMCLDQLASSLRTRLALREQVEAARGKIVMQARILLVLPVLVLVGLRSSQPLSAQTFDTPTGQLVLAGAVVALAAGYRLMLWLARLPSKSARCRCERARNRARGLGAGRSVPGALGAATCFRRGPRSRSACAASTWAPSSRVSTRDRTHAAAAAAVGAARMRRCARLLEDLVSPIRRAGAARRRVRQRGRTPVEVVQPGHESPGVRGPAAGLGRRRAGRVPGRVCQPRPARRVAPADLAFWPAVSALSCRGCSSVAQRGA